MTDKWYRHRIVKRLLIPDRSSSVAAALVALDVANAQTTLRERVKAEMSIYLRSHHPGQILLTEFVKPRAGGIEVFVARTLYGPLSVEDEIISELAERGEA